MTAEPILKKLKTQGWTLEPDRIYPDGCITFNRMGGRLVSELKQSGLLRPVAGCPGDWELSPATTLVAPPAEPQPDERPRGFRRFFGRKEAS
jgi:hypothetical protein